jgi:hypothetical protein
MEGERDFPVGHPAASDFDPSTYTPPENKYYVDFPKGHPARGGANVKFIDTPDGVKENTLHQVNNLKDLAAQGSLPQVFAPGKKEPLPLTPAQLAHFYAARLAYNPAVAPSDDARQAVGYITALGYSKDIAVQLFLDYAQPPKTAASAA